MDYDYKKRGYLLPGGCKDLGESLKLATEHDDVREALRKHVPEIASGAVEIVALARTPGLRCCIAVRSRAAKGPAVEPFELETVKAIVADLGGEYVTVIRWDPAPEKFIRHALQGLGGRLTVNSEGQHATLTIDPQMLKREKNDPRGQADLLVRLAEEVTGWEIRVVAPGQD